MDRKLLVEALNYLKEIPPKLETSYPILSCVHISADGTTATLRTTDQDITGQVTLPTKATLPPFLVKIKDLLPAIKGIKDQTIEFKIIPRQVTFNDYVLPRLPAEDFPSAPPSNTTDQKIVHLPIETIKKAYATCKTVIVKNAVSKSGINVSNKILIQNNNQMLYMVGTDFRRLSRYELTATDTDIKAIMDKKVFDIMAKIKEPIIELTFYNDDDRHYLKATTENYQLTAEVEDREYPDWQSAFDRTKKETNQYKMITSDLHIIFKHINSLFKNTASPAIFELKDQTIHIKQKEKRYTKDIKLTPTQIKKEITRMAFEPKYLEKVFGTMRALKDPVVTMEITAPSEFAYFYGKWGQFIIMPQLI